MTYSMNLDIYTRIIYKVKSVYSKYPIISYNKICLISKNDIDKLEEGRTTLLQHPNSQISPNLLGKEGNLYVNVIINACVLNLNKNKLDIDGFILKITKCSNQECNLNFDYASDAWGNNIKSRLTSIFYLKDENNVLSVITDLHSYNDELNNLKNIALMQSQKDTCINFFGGNCLTNICGEFIKVEYYLKTDNIINIEEGFVLETNKEDLMYNIDIPLDTIKTHIDDKFIIDCCIENRYENIDKHKFINKINYPDSIVITFEDNAPYYDINSPKFDISIQDTDHYNKNNVIFNNYIEHT